MRITLYALGIAALVACSDHNLGSIGDDASTDAGAADVILPPSEAGDGTVCATRCSLDLHDVLDCNNTFIKTCPPDQGCSPSGCIAACDAAVADGSTVGCEYFAVDPAVDGESDGSCYAAYIANTWTTDITLDVEYQSAKLDVSQLARIPVGSGPSLTYQPLPGGLLPAGQVAILFLADFIKPGLTPVRCPTGITAGVTNAPAYSRYTQFLDAFHITTSAPVAAYDIYPYGGAKSFISSATLLIPTSGWDTNYVTIDGWNQHAVLAQPFIEVVAKQNATQVTILPSVDIVGGNGVSSASKGIAKTYTLAPGQVLQIKQDEELNGSIIQSTEPVGVFGGNSCMDIDVGDTACDSGHQQLFPVRAMGSEYVAVKHANRTSFDESPPWRIMGLVNGTTLTYEPSTPTGAPATLDRGQVATFYTSSPFIVRSQDDKHPIYVSGHMMGQNSQGQSFGTGDPEWVNTLPPAEWLRRYVFFTDPTMANTNLVLVRKKSTDGTFKDVTLDCTPAALGGWQAIGTSNYEYTRFDVVIAGAAQGTCDNGLHTVKSDGDIGLTVWGWDTFVSYAYPSGASVQPINQVVIPPTPN